MLKKFVSVIVCVITSQQNFMSWMLGLNLRKIVLSWFRGDMNNGDRRRVNGEAKEDDDEDKGL
jgi:hypothetical protein